MWQYLNLLENILENGQERKDRTGVGTISLFAPEPLRFNLQEGFPIVTTRKMFWKGMVRELLFFLSGKTNLKDMHPSIHHWWKPWANSDGELKNIYGTLFRNFGEFKEIVNGYDSSCGMFCEHEQIKVKGVDQIKSVIDSIKTDPFSRRHIISIWNPLVLNNICLPACHSNFIQFYVESNGKELSCLTMNRSQDVFYGTVANASMISLLLSMIAHVCDLVPKNLTIFMGDAHLYINQIPMVEEQLKRVPLPLPKLFLNVAINDIDKFQENDIMLLDYQHHPPIKGPNLAI